MLNCRGEQISVTCDSDLEFLPLKLFEYFYMHVFSDFDAMSYDDLFYFILQIKQVCLLDLDL